MSEKQTIRKTRGMVAKVKKITKGNDQESNYPVQKRVNYIIVHPPMLYDSLWREEKDSQVKINQESRASSGIDQKERQSPIKNERTKRGKKNILKQKQQQFNNY